MKIVVFSILSVGLVFASPAHAQENDPDDDVVARATVQVDPAMSAWNAGDFVTAEIEFKQNAFCALRAERNFIAGVESARDSALNSNISASAGLAPSAAGPDGAAISAATSTSNAPVGNPGNNFKNKISNTKRTCEDRGFQLYMMGLSQLKLGKRDEAKASLNRAAAMRKNLFDAHFRLALMEYQDGDLKKANKHFKKLRKLEPKCKGCNSEAEIRAQIEYLDNLL